MLNGDAAYGLSKYLRCSPAWWQFRQVEEGNVLAPYLDAKWRNCSHLKQQLSPFSKHQEANGRTVGDAVAQTSTVRRRTSPVVELVSRSSPKTWSIRGGWWETR